MLKELHDVGSLSGPPVLTEANRILERCDELARLSEDEHGLTRTFLSPPMADAHLLVGDWMREAGMETRVDELGNIIGHYPAESGRDDAPVLLLGSHLDTVPHAGFYDGMLGVLTAIEAVSTLHSQGRRLPFDIDVFGFSEEEGVRFGTPYLGSRAVAGRFDPELLELEGRDGLSMRQVMRDFGLDPAAWERPSYESKRVLGYFEVHIEQGPLLEAENLPLALVTAIVGQSRWRVRFRGQAGHAGTQPMHMRLDALAAASEWIVGVENYAHEVAGLKATVGVAEVTPNAPNVVPGDVTCSLDVRHSDDMVRASAVRALIDLAVKIGTRRGIGAEVESRGEQKAVPMSATLWGPLRHAINALGVEVFEMESGAGHDAVFMANLAPCAMMFVRTPGGASHCIDEAVHAPDVELALHATVGFLEACAKELNVGLV